MNDTQSEFLRIQKDNPPAMKRHRRCYLMPWWVRDGYRSAGEGLLGRWGRTLVEHWANDAGNPNQEDAIIALRAFKRSPA